MRSVFPGVCSVRCQVSEKKAEGDNHFLGVQLVGVLHEFFLEGIVQLE